MFFFLIYLPDGAVAGSHDREVSLVLESATTVPLHHHLTLQYLLTHLAKVTQAQVSNGLDTHTLGRIFGPLLIRPDPSTPWYACLLIFYTQNSKELDNLELFCGNLWIFFFSLFFFKRSYKKIIFGRYLNEEGLLLTHQSMQPNLKLKEVFS